ncbi:hypothetical protein XPR_3551 [Xanthomonas arboricola pv. pruni MAFF 301420]|uniref:Uncharacterized protein n=1 Tax=Xanthomonas arboricola pv. pruni MAFF 301420 TaxID=1418095 RepID=W4SK98_9XANT|nr:hypothetical protein XPR_3551 [Xanthomonas arboricola pv. pruni MAFF 301420]
MRLNPLVLALAIAAAPAAANAASLENWPTKYTFGDGTELGLTGNYAYDDNNFSGDDRLEDRTDFRRKEFGATLKKKGVYDAWCISTSSPSCGWTCSSASRPRRCSARTTVACGWAT